MVNNMKKRRNMFLKYFSAFFIIGIIYFLIQNNTFAYEITYVATPIENPEGQAATTLNFPDMFYRKYVSAYETTITNYNKSARGQGPWSVRDNTFVYKADNASLVIDEDNFNEVHSNAFSFERYYEYFHRNNNTYYVTQLSPGETAPVRYYSSYVSKITTDVNATAPTGVVPKVVYNALNETGQYQGLYNGIASPGNVTTLSVAANPNIVQIYSNLYRFKVYESTFISDNIIESDTMRRMYNTFGDLIDQSGNLNVKVSSVLRTSYLNAKNGETYYKNMDTAFKFWETTVRGNTRRDLTNSKGQKMSAPEAWTNSPSTTGKDWEGNTDSERSVINYYDNNMQIPMPSKVRIYVRHIDVTNLESITSETIKEAPVIVTENGRANIHNNDNWESLVANQDRQNTNFYQEGYLFSDYYEKESNAQIMRLGNLKYEYNNQTTGQYFSYLNNADTMAKYADYSCLGAVVGKGDNINSAMEKRNEQLGYTGGNFRNLSSQNHENPTGGVVINPYRDSTSCIISGSEENAVIVIDFFYQKPRPQVYVRHINVQDISNIKDENLTDTKLYSSYRLKPSNGVAFKVNNSDWNTSSGEIARSQTNIDMGTNTYQEMYIMPFGMSPMRICNIFYDHETAGSYWNKLGSTEQNNFSSYKCIGAVVGKGNTIDNAEANRNLVKNNSPLSYSKSNIIALPDGYKSDNGLIWKNSNYTSVLLDNNENSKVIVIDFYYKTDITTDKKIYVRHIDISGKSSFKANDVDNAIANGNVLKGTGKAALSRDSTMYGTVNTLGTVTGYQEVYNSNTNYNTIVYRDPNEDYNCIGTNMKQSSTNSLANAKYLLDSTLNTANPNYDSSRKESVQVNAGISDVVIIDFYYKNKHDGVIKPKTEVGRLSYYTMDNENTFDANVNSTTTDVIPSGETLKAAINNAYSYMIGAINITPQVVDKTISFVYSISQPYKVSYLDWSSECSNSSNCGGTSSDKRTGYCGRIYTTTSESCSTDGCTTVTTSHTCSGNWSASSETVNTTGTITRYFKYQVPVQYTYYKIKNMRTYRIDKAILYDGHTNNGLPLFDGSEYQIPVVDAYDNAFKNAINTTFTDSGYTDAAVNNSKTLSTLNYTYSNPDGDVASSTAAGGAITAIESVFNSMTHSQAATISSMTASQSGNSFSAIISTPGNSINTALHVNNDKLAINDGVSSEVVIVGSTGQYENNKTIIWSEYTNGKTKSNTGTSSSNAYTYSNPELVELKAPKPTSVSDHYEPSKRTTKNYFKEVRLNIPRLRVNGIRNSYAKIFYKLVDNNNRLNFDVLEPILGQMVWARTAVAENMGEKFVDTEMYNTSNDGAKKGTTTYINRGALSKQLSFEYGESNNRNSDADVVNVFTPISFTTRVEGADENKIVNHSSKETISNEIQKNSKFTISMSSANHSKYGINTRKYIYSYYVKFDFDVQNIVINDAKGSRNYLSGNAVDRETWIGPIYNVYYNNYDDSKSAETSSNGTVSVSAVALADPINALQNAVVNQETNQYWVRAIAYNTPNISNSITRSLISDVATGAIENIEDIEDKSYIDTNGKNNYNSSASSKLHYGTNIKYYTQNNIFGDSKFVASTYEKTKNISRVYDFKVTDLLDLDWKSIFRKTSTVNTNVHTSVAYYAGVNKWNIYTTNYNDIIKRSTDEIGPTKQRILPIGPYKNEIATYMYAPKLGYKFSFDLKTTGKGTSKKIEITPKFYYINKSGTIFNDNIKLYYKNSSNKYVDISNYKLYFVPNDGYRLTFKGTDEAYRFNSSSMSPKSLSLGNTNRLTLTTNMMEQSDNTFVQIWYGEYKLPNSTIAVEDKGGTIDINNPLKDGYIGVVFDITVEEKNSGETIKIYYNKNDMSSGKPNTSQWDYEGYMGVTYGKEIRNSATDTSSSKQDALKLTLEKGTWTIYQDIYNKVKGTVILYDTDARASGDYQ